MNGLQQQLSQSADRLWLAILQGAWPGFPFWVLGLIALSILLGWPGAKSQDDTASHHTLLWHLRRAALGLALLGIAFTVLYRMLAYRVLGEADADLLMRDMVDRFWLLAIWVPVAAIVARLVWLRHGRPWLSARLRDVRITQPTDRLSDIRDEIDRWRGGSFDPRTFYAEGQVFTAVNDNGAPVSIDAATFRETHKCVIGATRFGKGVTFQAWADQAIAAGHAVWMFDPKGDEFLPLIMKARAKAAGKAFILLDLRDDGYGSWSPLRSGSLEERAVRMTEMLGLKERGTDADHYKALASDALLDLLRAEPDATLGKLLKEIRGARQLDEETVKALRSPVAKLKRLAGRRGLSPNSGKGLDVDASLRHGSVVYVIGSIEDADITLAQRLLLTELVQAARRLKAERAAPLTILLDELKFLASATVTRVLAAAASADINLCVAFQSFADMLSPDDATLDGRAVLQAVLTNCQVKMIFGGTDAETARWVAEASGTIRKRVVRMERTKVGPLGGETFEDQRSLGEEEEPLIPENTVLALPRGRAVLFRPGHLAQVVMVSPIRTPETEAVVQAKAGTAGTTAPAAGPISGP